jgi:hypothetical protein
MIKTQNWLQSYKCVKSSEVLREHNISISVERRVGETSLAVRWADSNIGFRFYSLIVILTYQYSYKLNLPLNIIT